MEMCAACEKHESTAEKPVWRSESIGDRETEKECCKRIILFAPDLFTDCVKVE